jgi:hypothetical protein
MARKSKVERPTIGKRKKKWRVEIWMESDNEPHPIKWDWENFIGTEPNLIVFEETPTDKWSERIDGN